MASDNNINDKLLNCYENWLNTIVQPEKKKEFKSVQLSDVFVSGVSEYNSNEKTILFIGQEARDWKWDENNKLDFFQKYSVGYLNRQIYSWELNRDEKSQYKCNRSPFWNFIRQFKDQYNVIWTNINKLHGITDGKTYAFTDKIETFNKPFYFDGKCQSILLHEIDIIKPDIIICMAGNSCIRQKYINSAFGEDITKQEAYSDFFDNKELFTIGDYNNAKIIFTHHPRYIQQRYPKPKPMKNFAQAVKEKL